MIAHCIPGSKSNIYDETAKHRDTFIMIGPEGDFTPDEIDRSITQGFLAVSLGNTRLRTETAGVAAAVMMQLNTAI